LPQQGKKSSASRASTRGAAKIVAIVSKPDKSELKEIAPQVAEWLKKRGYTVLVDRETATYVTGERVVEREKIAAERPRFVVVLGGDGTMLAAARAVAQAQIPILGANLGSLGFLTEVALDELYPTLEDVDRDRCAIERRAMVYCEVVRQGKIITRHDALNDAVVNKTDIARIADFDVYIDQEFVANYKADGIIVATPTGSTAYSLAAGGPILLPDVGALVITPVSPHALTNRPLVVRESSEIAVVVRSAEGAAMLSIDGQIGERLKDGDRVVCRKSALSVQLLKMNSRTFFDVLRTKLKWGAR
jgi:NAD+ kinase